jgi:hypothetical protein
MKMAFTNDQEMTLAFTYDLQMALIDVDHLQYLFSFASSEFQLWRDCEHFD